MHLRPAVRTDHDAILALNEASVHFLSPLDLARLRALDAEAAWHQVIEREGEVLGFVLAFREGAHYDSLNYRWFSERYARFLYIDRVVVSSAARGMGLGRLLYGGVFAYAQQHQIPWVACEYDIDPPNPASARFHTAFGFSEVGRQAVADGKKRVSLQAAKIA
ncbi:MAG: Acetyltransferase (GNAT) family protein [Alphaproteobacteria bacterium ADurb.BinA280]|jgi:predicted GNAT superfamily acetyltransferase|nr:MAG: Acetyltransferase (GNAT) family protein [Alphaproteobacteria bacterium ADurb.BinA280]